MYRKLTTKRERGKKQRILQKIETCGRTDLDDFWRLSGIKENYNNTHTPFLVFYEDEGKIKMDILKKAEQLLGYPDSTKVMQQWSGKWSSDFFQFTVGDYRNFIEDPVSYYGEEEVAKLKTAKDVCITYGPRGNCRGMEYKVKLSFQDSYCGVHSSGGKEDERLVEFFKSEGIPIKEVHERK